MTPYYFTASVIAVALISAAYDSKVINLWRSIKHVPRWLVRAAVVVLAAYITKEWVLLLGSWGLFNVVFRPCLNLWRNPKRSVWYISPSNVYDWVVLWVYFRLKLGGSGWLPSRKQVKQSWAHNMTFPHFVSDIHRAGKLAYIVELAAFGMAVYIRGII
jgi:hypothetical protein